ncbi:MAG: zinc ribbon-containing protein [Methylococcales bacterium]|nr:zinc ribbon-containing protein [Methylococcales bacterium]
MSDNKLIKAYDDLMTHLYEAMDGTLHSVAEALEIAKKKTGAMAEHSPEDVDRAADFVMRDIHHAASNAADNEKDSLSEWLKFDIDLIENFALDAFWSIADKTRIKLAELEMDAQLYHPYKSGDIAGPGTFSCEQCNKEISFKSTSVVPECPACHSRTFNRC